MESQLERMPLHSLLHVLSRAPLGIITLHRAPKREKRAYSESMRFTFDIRNPWTFWVWCLSWYLQVLFSGQCPSAIDWTISTSLFLLSSYFSTSWRKSSYSRKTMWVRSWMVSFPMPPAIYKRLLFHGVIWYNLQTHSGKACGRSKDLRNCDDPQPMLNELPTSPRSPCRKTYQEA